MPERIQLSRKKGWRLPEGAVSVARPGRWGNPFKIGERFVLFPNLGWGPPTSLKVGPINAVRPMIVVPTVVEIADRAQAVEWFRAWMESYLNSENRLDLSVLTGHDLACWCPLDGGPCHADVLLELANHD